jgi:hypothetical protein
MPSYGGYSGSLPIWSSSSENWTISRNNAAVCLGQTKRQDRSGRVPRKPIASAWGGLSESHKRRKAASVVGGLFHASRTVAPLCPQAGICQNKKAPEGRGFFKLTMFNYRDG